MSTTGTVNDALRWWAVTSAEHPAIDVRGETVTYRELEAWVARIARRLSEAGVEAGDRVGVIAANTPTYCAAVLGAIQAGAVVAPFNNRLVRSELAELVAYSAPRVVLGDEAHLGTMKQVRDEGHSFELISFEGELDAMRQGPDERSAPGEVSDTDPAIIVFTSGTTSAPKGAIFTHGVIAGMVNEWSLREPTLGAGGVRLGLVLPLGSAAGLLWGLVKVVMHGGTLHLEPRFEPGPTLEVLSTNKVQVLCGPPIIFEHLSKAPGFADADLSHLEFAAVGGARVGVELLQSWLDKGVVLRQMYGLTEAGGFATINSKDGAVSEPGKCGGGSMFTRLRVVDEQGADQPVGETGQIIVRGPGVTAGYWQNQEATDAALRDGWLHTGDLGHLDENGSLTYVDRLKDLIISGGFNMSPSEVETVVQRHEGVEEVAVIAAPDQKFGETPAAIVYSPSGVDVPGLIAHCDENLADFKVPRYVVVVDEPLPRMASGKIAKRQLREAHPDIPGTHPKVR